MKKATITISFEQEKLKAVQFYMSKSGTSLEAELDDFMGRLYKKFVPSQTREYLESQAEADHPPRHRPSSPENTAASSTLHTPGDSD